MWPDLAARARGLSAHLLDPAALARLDHIRDAATLSRELVAAGYTDLRPTQTNADEVDRATRVRAAAELAILERWAGERKNVLSAVFDDVDRRSLRALVRGLAGRASTTRRLASTIPTPGLPERDLAALAAATTTIDDMAALLWRRRHPYAAAVAASPADRPIDLLAVETALVRCFVDRARHHGRRHRALARYVEQVIDTENASAALLLGARGGDLDPATSFVTGGVRIDPVLFRDIATMPVERGRARLARVFARTALADALRTGAQQTIALAALDWQLATQARLRRTDPLGAAPLLWLVASRRRETAHVRRAAWRLALHGGAR